MAIDWRAFGDMLDLDCFTLHEDGTDGVGRHYSTYPTTVGTTIDAYEIKCSESALNQESADVNSFIDTCDRQGVMVCETTCTDSMSYDSEVTFSDYNLVDSVDGELQCERTMALNVDGGEWSGGELDVVVEPSLSQSSADPFLSTRDAFSPGQLANSLEPIWTSFICDPNSPTEGDVVADSDHVFLPPFLTHSVASDFSTSSQSGFSDDSELRFQLDNAPRSDHHYNPCVKLVWNEYVQGYEAALSQSPAEPFVECQTGQQFAEVNFVDNFNYYDCISNGFARQPTQKTMPTANQQTRSFANNFSLGVAQGQPPERAGRGRPCRKPKNTISSLSEALNEVKPKEKKGRGRPPGSFRKCRQNSLEAIDSFDSTRIPSIKVIPVGAPKGETAKRGRKCKTPMISVEALLHQHHLRASEVDRIITKAN